MAKNNLASLAALGALGMMMSKGKGKEADVDTSKISDMDLTGGARSMTPDTGEIRAEDGSMSKLRRNTETGDLYSPNEPITSPSAPKARASTSSSKSSISADDEAGASRGMRNRAGAGRGVTMPTQPQADSTTAEGMRNYVSRAQTGMDSDTTQADIIRRLAATSGVPLRGRGDEVNKKKGGVVKMAKGGMTSSASSRGDGIAQRGKTRGTMIMCGGGYTKGKR